MIPYKQLSLTDIFADCQNKFLNDKSVFLPLLADPWKEYHGGGNAGDYLGPHWGRNEWPWPGEAGAMGMDTRAGKIPTPEEWLRYAAERIEAEGRGDLLRWYPNLWIWVHRQEKRWNEHIYRCDDSAVFLILNSIINCSFRHIRWGAILICKKNPYLCGFWRFANTYSIRDR